MKARLLWFAKHLWSDRRFIFQSPIIWHNARAIWIQSDPDWITKMEPIELTDEEVRAFIEAINE
jgi:hypothetical protein